MRSSTRSNRNLLPQSGHSCPVKSTQIFKPFLFSTLLVLSLEHHTYPPGYPVHSSTTTSPCRKCRSSSTFQTRNPCTKIWNRMLNRHGRKSSILNYYLLGMAFDVLDLFGRQADRTYGSFLA